jgi:predicted NAD/FAD-binding protein
LFHELEVPYENTDMSFSVYNKNIGLEYNGSSLDGLFAQKRNLLNLKFLKMIKEILKFNKKSVEMLDAKDGKELSIKEYIKSLNLSDYFYSNFLIPMSSAVWSTPIDKMDNFPARSLIRFFHNHGFVGVNTQLQWKTVTGGSREYRNRLLAKLNHPVMVNSKVQNVTRVDNEIEVKTDSGVYKFDRVIIATHGDEALSILNNPTENQKRILSKFSYQENIAIVHTDKAVMPTLKKNWSSWNFVTQGNETYTVYYMNKLQRISKAKDFFVNINGERFVNPNKVLKRIVYHHPLFDIPAVEAQSQLDELNRETNIHFVGSYYRYGFHEDALLSSVNLCSSLLNRKVFK